MKRYDDFLELRLPLREFMGGYIEIMQEYVGFRVCQNYRPFCGPYKNDSNICGSILGSAFLLSQVDWNPDLDP